MLCHENHQKWELAYSALAGHEHWDDDQEGLAAISIFLILFSFLLLFLAFFSSGVIFFCLLWKMFKASIGSGFIYRPTVAKLSNGVG